MMKAYIYDDYGSSEVLKFREVVVPQPLKKQVLVKIYSVCINDWDYGNLIGKPFVNRLFNGIKKPKLHILGSDIAGEVVAIGEDITKFQIGDLVYGDLSNQKWGGFAEYVCAFEESIELKPKELTFDQAASMPQAAMLAVQGLIDYGKIKQGQSILINGAGGGVGTFGVQIAKLYDAQVTGVDNADKLDMMYQVGFDQVIDYQKEDFTKSSKKYDLILDNKTNRSVFKYLRVLKRGGVYVSTGGHMFRVLQLFLMGKLISLTTSKLVKVVILKSNKDLLLMNELFEAGKVKPVIDGHYRFDELKKAFSYYESGKHKGKVVITIINGQL